MAKAPAAGPGGRGGGRGRFCGPPGVKPVLQVWVKGVGFHMLPVGFRRVHTPHCGVKCLAFQRGMGGYVQLSGALPPGPVRGGQEQSPPDTAPAQILRHMQRRKVQILPFGAEKFAFHRHKAFQPARRKGGIDQPAGAHGAAQALTQEPVVRLRPAVHERAGAHGPPARVPAQAEIHHLMADEVAEQARFDLLFPQCTPGQRQVRRGAVFSGLQGGSPPPSQALTPAPAGRWRTAPLPGSAGTCGRRSRWSRSGRPARGRARPWPRRRRLPAQTCRC